MNLKNEMIYLQNKVANFSCTKRLIQKFTGEYKKYFFGEFFYFPPAFEKNISFEKKIKIIKKELYSLPCPPSKLFFGNNIVYGIWYINETNTKKALNNIMLNLENQIREFELDTCDLECLSIVESKGFTIDYYNKNNLDKLM